MNAREWKPGDVAMVTYRLGQCTERNLCAKTDKGWDCLAPGVGFLMHGDVVDAHPLVVIDPENRVQVERLVVAHCRAYCCDPAPLQPEEVAIMQAALREFATPKPVEPVEPTGLGAVVEDTKGRRWVRVGINAFRGAESWQCAPTEMGWTSYAEIDAVRVLSEGVTQ